MVLSSGATLLQIQEALEASVEAPIRLDAHYILKLRKKIYSERLRRNNNLNKGARIAYIQDKHRIIEQRLWGEAANSKNPGVVRVMALEKIMKNELDLLKAEMDAGFYERQIGTLTVNGKVEHEHTLAPEILDPILRALRNYGLIKPKIIEQYASPTPAIPGGGDQASAIPAPASADAQAIPRI